MTPEQQDDLRTVLTLLEELAEVSYDLWYGKFGSANTLGHMIFVTRQNPETFNAYSRLKEGIHSPSTMTTEWFDTAPPPAQPPRPDIRLAIASAVDQYLQDQDPAREPLRLLHSEEFELGERILSVLAEHQISGVTRNEEAQ